MWGRPLTTRNAESNRRWLPALAFATGVSLIGSMVGCGSTGSAPDEDGGSHHDARTTSDVTTVHDSGGQKPHHDAGHDAGGKAPHDAHARSDAEEAGPDSAGDVVVVPDASHCPDASVLDGATILNCTGKCGPITDPCNGSVTQCGGCAPLPGVDGGAAQPQVCNLTTSTCGPVQTTCADLGAACGTVANSCGTFLDCPDGTTKGCPAGQDCNTNTNQCETCQPVTCGDLGFQCGLAWLGCGPDTESNYVDCGSCGPTQVCNEALDICEPTCTPGTAAATCAAAGAQCGIITDGCGGTVDCDTVTGLGCPSGQGCGVQGIANVCAATPTPVECVALGQNCGSIISACTGQSISCGQCATGQVCNPNGVCGTPCPPKTCADFPDIDCGTFPDGCGKSVTCGSCPGSVCNQTTHACCPSKTCGTDYIGECGTGLADGCGGNALNCPCNPASDVCSSTTPGTAGTCCAPLTGPSYVAMGECGTQLPNSCGQSNVTATCVSPAECTPTTGPGAPPGPGVIGTCCTSTSACSSVTAGNCGEVADTCNPANKTLCNECSVAPKTLCVNNDECCSPAPACPANACNITEPNADCGPSKTCSCTGTAVCLCGGVPCTGGAGQGTCTAPDTCGTTYKNECGTGLTNGVGGTINCGCGGGMSCSTTSPTVTTPGAGVTGTCICSNGTGAAYTCADVPVSVTGGAACGTFNNGCGGSITCNCTTPGDVCDSKTTPATCCAPTSCPANPVVGTACGNLSNSCGSTNSCGCGTGGDVCNGGACCAPTSCPTKALGSACGNLSNSCGGTNSCGCLGGDVCNAGACCAPTSCPAQALGSACGNLSNSCGGTNSCGCPGGDVCNAGACCAPTSCPAVPGVGTVCGSVSNSCGGTNSCSCPTGLSAQGYPNTNFTCTAGLCKCIPNTCTGLSGIQDDGCGGTQDCK